ncbi:MAG TPA: ATP-binding protein [Candidatus Aminicenantes bacterium]|nr:ATP-binding protein [Candidatus Aminicenantes bacterium]
MTGPDGKELRVPAKLEEIDRVRDFLRTATAALPLDEEALLKIELALHEICVNIARYAYPPGREGDMAVRIWRDEDSLFIEVRDKGIPFNPIRKKNPNLMVKLRRGVPGGLGVYFFKTLMDGLSYRRADGQNILTVRKAL